MNTNEGHKPGALVVCLILLLGELTFANEAPTGHEGRTPALRDQLLEREAEDQRARKAAIEWAAKHPLLSENGVLDKDSLPPEDKATHEALWGVVARIDEENTRWLKEIVSEGGWPLQSEVGVDGANAAWLLLQHADEDAEFQRFCLDLMTSLPREEVSQQNLAALTDRVLIAEGKNQVYGTQFVVRNGEWVPLRLEDEENVDARRAEVGLPPMAEYRKLLEAVMRGETEID